VLAEVHHYLASQVDVLIRRNNVGFYRSESGHPIAYGLGKGSPDLVGSVALPFFGRTIAQAIGVEVKSATGRVSADQQAWHAGAQLMGWRVAVVRSVADAEQFLASVRRGS
jgi:hypothetical protein